MKSACALLLIVSFHGASFHSHAQDTVRQKTPFIQRNGAQKIIGTIKRTPPPDSVIVIKSEDSFLPYEGKIIRTIIINQIGFDRTVQDTSRTFKTAVAKVANKLHNDSKSWVIRNNLFIREGKPLNPYRVADNERYLRDLDFILDSRIYVLPISEESDSVDLLVMTRDVFSLGATFSPYSATEYRWRVQEANLGGMGQRLQVAGVYNDGRNPKTGHEFLYQKTNLFGSFVNANLGYTELNSARSTGNENEYSYYVRLNRPLFNPFARWAGGLEWSRNWSQNNFGEEKNSFADYRYDVKDLWAGYSFGIHKLTSTKGENRNRTIVAVRAFEQTFGRMPNGSLTFDERITYANRATVLSQVSFFKQNFYKTRYVLGFGRTEDVPYGYRISFTGGWEKERGIARPYTGAEILISSVNANGTFYSYDVKVGNYWRSDLIEDALAQFNVSRYSRLYRLGKVKVRHLATIGFASLLNQALKRNLDIRDVNGITGFRPDSLRGTQRLKFATETVVFTPWKLLGFNLAPLTRIDLSYLAQENKSLIQKGNFYSGFSAALRARNENLIFNTVEGRVYYFPKTVEGLDHWRVDFRVNIRIKYPTDLVTAPATVYDP
jgi:hypothetical protein